MRRQWEAELLPQCLAMGIGYEEFWSLTPRKLNVIIDGYKLRQQLQDEQNWMLGGYVFCAVSVAIGNATRKKNQKAKEYFEVIDKPFFKQKEEELTEESKQKYIDAFMSQLHVMKNNFELNH